METLDLSESAVSTFQRPYFIPALIAEGNLASLHQPTSPAQKQQSVAHSCLESLSREASVPPTVIRKLLKEARVAMTIEGIQQHQTGQVKSLEVPGGLIRKPSTYGLT